MKNIKQKLIVFVGVLFIAVCSCLSIVSYTNASKVLMNTTKDNLTNVAGQASDIVASSIAGNLKEMETIASRKDLRNRNITKAEKIQILFEEAERAGCQRMTIIDLDGNSFNGNGKEQYLGDREYFTKALKGESNLTDPTIGKSTGDLLVFYAVPMYTAENIVGVLQSVHDGTKLSELTNSVKYGENGKAYMISSDGTIIAHQDNDVVMNCENIIAMAESDASYASYAAAIKEATENESGFAEYVKDGVSKYLGYSQVDKTTWKVIVEIDKAEVLAGLNSLRNTSIITSILFILVGLIVAYFIASSISKGIQVSSKKLETMADGDFRFVDEEKYTEKKDEIGDMTRAMRSMSESIAKTIAKIKNNSSDIDEQSVSLSRSAEEISTASHHVADSISEVARGAVTQSEGLLDITGILEEFGFMVEKMVDEISDVNKTSVNISNKAAQSSTEMQKINVSVEKVDSQFKAFRQQINGLGNSVSEINQFIDVINQIASQTNLLALNASIEAARAGEAGRGFAVVAEEIRALAEQTAQSSAKISQLVTSVSDGTKVIVSESEVMDNELAQEKEVIDASIESFNAIIAAIEEIIPKINVVESSVGDLDTKKNAIMQNVEDVSSAASEVSASAEEISAAAEEMSASIVEMAEIADVLKERASEMTDSVNVFTVD